MPEVTQTRSGRPLDRVCCCPRTLHWHAQVCRWSTVVPVDTAGVPGMARDVPPVSSIFMSRDADQCNQGMPLTRIRHLVQLTAT